jgi:hypothetical protein
MIKFLYATSEASISHSVEVIGIQVQSDGAPLVRESVEPFAAFVIEPRQRNVGWKGGAPMWLSMTFWAAAGCRTSRRATWRTARRSGDVQGR